MSSVIKVDNVLKIFKLSKKQQQLNKTNKPELIAVNGLSFEVKKGEIYGLLGSNGAGKTTMLRMISTLISPNEGDIIVNGYSVKKNPREVRENIAFLTSELKLEGFFTPSYLFDYYSDLRNIPKDVQKTRKEKLFHKFDIEGFQEVKVDNLSTGMQQKASLAISLVHDPDIIVFDEPTNGLDVLTAKIVTDFLIEMKEQGKTIIVSTHIFSLIEKICDRVGIIVAGKMAVEKTLPEILSEKSLEDYFFDIYKKEVGETL